MYNTKYLLESLDAFMASAGHRLTAAERVLLEDIRDCIANERDQDKIEKGFSDLVKWLILLKDYLDKL